MADTSPTFSLLLVCPDRKGIVAAVAGFLSDHDASIVEAKQFNDQLTSRFYMRAVFTAVGPKFVALEQLRAEFAALATPYEMTWQIEDCARRVRVLIAVSKLDHCLQDLLHRWRSGVLPADVVGVVSNHPDLRGLVEWHQIPFFHLPVTGETRPQQEAAMLELFSRYRADLLVLARYMQVLSNETCRALAGRCINIHHSFLPSFKGARPYHQAYQRGVKIIGATAHYVTEDLDEGPIIEQAVERVGHEHTPERFQEIGRDLEAIVLARAVRWHAERRILLDGQRSVILS
ncbi:MAG TPA: formyltetrahydrofolate deformylase [Steroidobacteraceae bacterium]|jgi:formyltetrahydrofolate deformylase|nr:formyltetrahydrofolate deformylase [Steroidobacteraceae bacterium]